MLIQFTTFNLPHSINLVDGRRQTFPSFVISRIEIFSCCPKFTLYENRLEYCLNCLLNVSIQRQFSSLTASNMRVNIFNHHVICGKGSKNKVIIMLLERQQFTLIMTRFFCTDILVSHLDQKCTKALQNLVNSMRVQYKKATESTVAD